MPRLRLLECRMCIAFQAVTPVPATFVYTDFSLEGRAVERLALCEQHHGAAFDQILFALGWSDLAGEIVDLNVVGTAPAPADLQGPARASVAELPQQTPAELPAPPVVKTEVPTVPEPRQGTLLGADEATPPSPTAPPAKRRPSGQWLPDDVQVICPLPHRAGATIPYWVKVGERGGHADHHARQAGEHHGIQASEINWVLQPDAAWTDWCTEHEICMRTPGGKGYPFTGTHQLHSHQGKSKHWAPARAPDDPPVPAVE